MDIVIPQMILIEFHDFASNMLSSPGVIGNKTLMIHFKDPDFNDEQIASEPLSPEEEDEVIDFINSLISKSDEENSEKVALLQRFVYQYETLSGKLADER